MHQNQIISISNAVCYHLVVCLVKDWYQKESPLPRLLIFSRKWSWHPTVHGAETLLCLFSVGVEKHSLQVFHPFLDFSGQCICNPIDASCSAVPWLCSAPLLWGISAALSASLSCSQAVASHVSSGLSHFLVVFCGYWYSGEQVWPRGCDPDLSSDLWSRISLQQVPSIPVCMRWEMLRESPFS